MTASTVKISEFITKKSSLSDRSEVHDVYLVVDGELSDLVAAPPSETAATELCLALNRVMERFLQCESDREVRSLASALDEFLDRHNKSCAQPIPA